MNTDIGSRLKYVLEDKKMSLKEFSRQSGISYRTLQEYMKNKMVPGGELLVELRYKLNISIDWLLTGEGPMYLSTQISSLNSTSIDLLKEGLEKLKEERMEEMQKVNEMKEKLKEMEKKIINN